MDSPSPEPPQEIAGFFDYLTRQPPYEAVGKVILAAAEVDLGLHEMCEVYGRPWPATAALSVPKRLAFLFGVSDLEREILLRVQPAMERRHLLAHGLWLNTREHGEAFVTRTEETSDLQGERITLEVLEKWRSELQDIADYFTSVWFTKRSEARSAIATPALE